LSCTVLFGCLCFWDHGGHIVAGVVYLASTTSLYLPVVMRELDSVRRACTRIGTLLLLYCTSADVFAKAYFGLKIIYFIFLLGKVFFSY
jgi:hypothetical protein